LGHNYPHVILWTACDSSDEHTNQHAYTVMLQNICTISIVSKWHFYTLALYSEKK